MIEFAEIRMNDGDGGDYVNIYVNGITHSYLLDDVLERMQEVSPAAELAALRAERDEAENNANNYRARVLDFLDGMEKESLSTQETEEASGLETDREEFRAAIAYIRRAFESHDYLKEAELEAALKGIE